MLIIWNILRMILNVQIVVKMLLKDVVYIKVNGIVLGNVKLKDRRFIKNYVKHLETLFKEEEGFNKQKKEFNMIKTKSDNNYDKDNKNENNDEKKK